MLKASSSICPHKKIKTPKIPFAIYVKTINVTERRCRLGHRFREHLRDVEINDKDASNQSPDTSISLTTLNSTWRLTARLSTEIALKAARSQNNKLLCQLGAQSRNATAQKQDPPSPQAPNERLCSLPAVQRSAVRGNRNFFWRSIFAHGKVIPTLFYLSCTLLCLSLLC